MKYSIFTPNLEKNSNLSFWQSDFWKNILYKSNQAEEVFYFWNEKSTFFLVEIRSVWAGFFGAFILGLQNNQISTDFADCLESLKNFLKNKKNIIFLQIEPLDNLDLTISCQNPIKKFLTPFTRVISLEQTEDEILAWMTNKARYAIRNAIKKWVEIDFIQNIDDQILDIWMELLEETTSRDDFSHNSREYYKNFFEILSWKIFITCAKYQQKIIAMTVNVVHNNTCIYYYGASTSDVEARKLASSYATLYYSMTFAKNNFSCKKYDLLGVADPDNPNDPLSWVSQFKQKLGWELVKLPKKFLFPISTKFYFYRILVKIKKFLKK